MTDDHRRPTLNLVPPDADHTQPDQGAPVVDEPRIPPVEVIKVQVIVTVEVDPDAWVRAYGTAESSVADDVRRYVGGLVATGEATYRRAVIGVDVSR